MDPGEGGDKLPGISYPHPGYLQPGGKISQPVNLAPRVEDNPAGLSCPPP